MARRMEDASEVMGLPAGSLEDKDLTLAYQRGEDGAYQAIYDRYSTRVHSVCRRMLGNSQDAQDAAQESFLRVYQALGRFNGRYQLGPWITRIATNVCLDHIRSKSRRPKDVVQLEIAELDANESLEIDGPDDIVIRKSEGRRVRRVLESLPPMHRAAIVLRDFEGLSYQEVAIALGITDCQVKALIHRARQGFKRSWTSIALGVLLPTRLFERIRKLHTPKGTGTHGSSVQQFAESFTASAAPAASSCSAAFSHCGQFVADKFAPAVTAVALGAASLVGPGLVRAENSGEAPRNDAATIQDSTEFQFANQGGRSVKPAPRRVEPASTRALAPSIEPTAGQGPVEDDKAAAPAVAETPVPPMPQAGPSPAAPQPTPAPPQQKPEQGSGATPSAPPVVGVNLSPSTGSSRIPDSMSTVFKCSKFVLDHSLSSIVSREGSSWPLRLHVTAARGEVGLEAGVAVSGGEVLFRTEGVLGPLSKTGDQLSVGAAGTYRTSNMEAQDTLGVPLSGNFQFRLTLDCASRSVIAESLSFEA